MTMNAAEKRAFSTKEAAQYLSVSESHLKHARTDGVRPGRLDAPSHVKLAGGRVVYLREELDGWLDAKAAQTVSGAAA